MLLTLTTALVLGGWGGGQCSGQSTGPALVIAQPQPARYEWKPFDDDPEQWALTLNGAQVGGYCSRDGEYRSFDAATRTWLARAVPPIPPPTPARAEIGQNFGVDASKFPKLQPGESIYTVNGKRVNAQQAYRLVEAGGTLTDDSAKLRLTVVGTKEECDKVEGDLKTSPLLTPFKDKMLVQCYRPTDWAVAGVNLPTDGKPRIILQGPPDKDGKAPVLHSQPDYDGPDGLAKALRKADPSYDPKKDPDLRHPPLLPGLPDLAEVPPIVWLVAAVGVLAALKKGAK